MFTTLCAKDDMIVSMKKNKTLTIIFVTFILGFLLGMLVLKLGLGLLAL